MREIKFKVVWNNEVSNEAFTIGEFVDGVEMSFKDGGTLPFKDIDWSEDKIEYLQYTGLKDKNGVEIYEGDILGYWGSACWLLEWNNEKSEYGFRYYNEPTLRNDEPFLNHFAFRATPKECIKKEVIGNVYQNPELLNTK